MWSKARKNKGVGVFPYFFIDNLNLVYIIYLTVRGGNKPHPPTTM